MQKKGNGRLLGGCQASMVTVYLIRGAHVRAMSSKNVLQVGGICFPFLHLSKLPRASMRNRSYIYRFRVDDCRSLGLTVSQCDRLVFALHRTLIMTSICKA